MQGISSGSVQWKRLLLEGIQGGAITWTKILLGSDVGIASGVAGLDGVSKVPTINLGGSGASSSNYLRGDQTWATPTGAGGADVKQTEIDFGATPIGEALFIITDTSVSTSSQIIGSVAYEAPTGKELDELEMDTIALKFAPGTGQFTIYAKGLEGYLADKFKINYLVG